MDRHRARHRQVEVRDR